MMLLFVMLDSSITVVFRCDRNSSLMVCSDRGSRMSWIPEFVIFNEISADSTRIANFVGTMKTVSKVEKEWVEHLIPRFDEARFYCPETLSSWSHF